MNWECNLKNLRNELSTLQELADSMTVHESIETKSERAINVTKRHIIREVQKINTLSPYQIEIVVKIINEVE